MTSFSHINQNNEEQHNRLSAVDRINISDEIKAIEKRKATSAWYNPAKIKERADNGDWVKPDTVFLGESKGVPTWQYVFDTDIDNIFTAR